MTTSSIPRAAVMRTALAALLLILPASGTALAADKHRTRLPGVHALQFYLRWSPERTPLISAHRGGPVPGYPENAIETFDNALTYAPCVIECDVAATADDSLILMHDDRLDRTTTGSGPVDSLTWEQIRQLRLIDNEGDTTDYRVPLFRDVLRWAKDNAILTVDVKRSVPFEAVVEMIRQMEARSAAVVITYNADQAQLVHELDPQIVLSVGVRSDEDLQRLLDRGLEPNVMVAFVGVSEPDEELYELLHGYGIRTILGTMGNLDRRAAKRGSKVYLRLYENGADILSTDNVPLASDAVNAYIKRHFDDH